MSTETQRKKSAGSATISADVKIALEEIACDLNMNDFEILNKNVPFTGDNYCGDISFVTLKSSENGYERSVDLFVKKAIAAPAAREAIPLYNVYESEIFTYTDIFPAFDMLEQKHQLPEDCRTHHGKIYKACLKEFEELLILNDLTKEGLSLRDKKTAFDLDHASLIMKHLAKLHSLSFVMKKEEPELFSRLTKSISKSFVYENFLMPIFDVISSSSLQCVECPENKKKLEEIVKNGAQILRKGLDSSLWEPYNVICHGDSWNNNMLFKYKDGKVQNMVLIDWQLVRYSSPVTDIITVMCFSMDKVLLDSHFHSLLDIYHETLGQRLAMMDCDVEECYPMMVFKENVKRIVPYGMAMAAFGLPISLSDSEGAKPIEHYINESEPTTALSNLVAKRINEILNFFVDNELL